MNDFIINPIEGFSIFISGVVCLIFVYVTLYYFLPKLTLINPNSDNRAILGIVISTSMTSMFCDNMAVVLAYLFGA